jgi:hypothetical protein
MLSRGLQAAETPGLLRILRQLALSSQESASAIVAQGGLLSVIGILAEFHTECTEEAARTSRLHGPEEAAGVTPRWQPSLARQGSKGRNFADVSPGAAALAEQTTGAAKEKEEAGQLSQTAAAVLDRQPLRLSGHVRQAVTAAATCADSLISGQPEAQTAFLRLGGVDVTLSLISALQVRAHRFCCTPGRPDCAWCRVLLRVCLAKRMCFEGLKHPESSSASRGLNKPGSVFPSLIQKRCCAGYT